MPRSVIAHGIDLVDISRVADMLDRHGAHFVDRCFTQGERAYADSGRKRRAERYAARFACKEAVFKALGTGWRSGIRWTDVEVVNEPSGRPLVRVGGRCLEVAAGLDIDEWHLSLSHAAGPVRAGVEGARAGFAVASIIACGIRT